MHFTALDHVGFTVSDMFRSVEFYTELLGDPPITQKLYEADYLGRIVGYPGVKLKAAFWSLPGNTILELLEYVEPPPGTVDMETFNVGNGHLCLVTDDLHRDFARLDGKVEFRDPEPVRIAWGPYEGALACYLRDPDGISIELMQSPPNGVSIAA